MKKHFLSLLLVCTAVCYAQFPVTDPEIGDGRLVVCAQNARNYFVVDLANKRPDYHDAEGLEDKTDRMVRVFRHLDADIFAVCELECQDSAVAYLTRALNTAAGKTVYSYVADKQNVGNGQIKSGFIYRNDKIKPYGSNTAASPQQYYRYTMRLQAFEELATGERFVLSMNHFKAKDNTEDQGNAKRERNATDLLNALDAVTADPDILIMGDLNCTVGESPLDYILNAGYTELMLKYDSDAYSHRYNGNELIDHAFGNGTMTAQVRGAGVFHINTGTNKYGDWWYSDHDPILVSMNLSSGTPDPDPEPDPDPDTECTPLDYKRDFKQGLEDFAVYTPQGAADWYINDKYGAIVNGYTKPAPMESWLISPEFDLHGTESASVTFRHNIFYDNSNGQYADLQTFWYSTDYEEADPETATWHQLAIPDYGVKKWVNTTVNLPADALQSRFRYAFKYVANTSEAANYWEIDNTALTSVCLPMSMEEVRGAENGKPAVRKYIQNGTLYIQVGDKTYTVLGEIVR